MNFDIDTMNKKELEQHLSDEFSHYEIENIVHLLVQEIPKRYIMRVINKMYRERRVFNSNNPKEEQNGVDE